MKYSSCLPIFSSLLTALFLFALVHIFWILEVRLFVVTSNSMQPALSIGSLIATVARDKYQPGDVVSFTKYAANNNITTQSPVSLTATHRIVKTDYAQIEPRYLTKGDINPEPDSQWINHSQIKGKVVLELPFVGYILFLIRSWAGLTLIVGLSVLLGLIDSYQQQISSAAAES